MNITKLIINTKYDNLKLDHHMLCVPHKTLFVKSAVLALLLPAYIPPIPKPI